MVDLSNEQMLTDPGDQANRRKGRVWGGCRWKTNPGFQAHVIDWGRICLYLLRLQRTNYFFIFQGAVSIG